jgi:hypothetical protein
VQQDESGKLAQWLYGCRLVAQVWEEHYSSLFKENGLIRFKSVPAAHVRKERGISGEAHGGNCVWEGRGEDLGWAMSVLSEEEELKNRRRLGLGPKDVSKIGMLGRIIELTDKGIVWQSDHRYPDVLQGYFGKDAGAKTFSKNGDEGGPPTRTRMRGSSRPASAKHSECLRRGRTIWSMIMSGHSSQPRRSEGTWRIASGPTS